MQQSTDQPMPTRFKLASRRTNVRSCDSGIIRLTKHNGILNSQDRSQQKAQDDRISQLKKLHLKLKTFVDDIHLKLSSELVKSYRFVALGKIPVSQIVKKDKPKHLNKRANRDLLCWRHYAFRQRLLHRAAETDCQVIIQDEKIHVDDLRQMWYKELNVGRK